MTTDFSVDWLADHVASVIFQTDDDEGLVQAFALLASAETIVRLRRAFTAAGEKDVTSSSWGGVLIVAPVPQTFEGMSALFERTLTMKPGGFYIGEEGRATVVPL